MAKANSCILENSKIGIVEALELRDIARQRHLDVPDFRCSQCEQPVHPHKASSFGVAHFEHLNRNPHCKLSDPAR